MKTILAKISLLGLMVLLLPSLCSAQKKEELTEEDFKTWYLKDMEEDTIPGISLDRAYRELLQNKEGNEVIVAVLDTKLDIHHEDLKDQIWVNVDEIPDNVIDDDKNGYIDDINGWNFLGNNKGEDLLYAYDSYVRLFKKYRYEFENVDRKDLPENKIKIYDAFVSAKEKYENELEVNLRLSRRSRGFYDLYLDAKSTLETYFGDSIFSLERLTVLKSKDTIYSKYTELFEVIEEEDITEADFENTQEYYNRQLEVYLNLEYDERSLMGDDENDIEISNYGNEIVFGSVPFEHSIKVVGVLAATRNNNIGFQGFSNNIKIMPVVMVASGGEHDKDVSLAIKYAVDNGADIINMSWGSFYSTNEPWVTSAIKYASDNDVLLVTAAGNYATDIDKRKYYPQDYFEDKEFADNFIVAGASTVNIDSTLIASFSNYGKKNVDIFAPGENIYTTDSANKYTSSGGTSLATPMVSGIAALIKSFYPNLRASEIKNIILESGTSHNLEVLVSQEDDTKKLVHFSELSKSGKILNAYSALLLAEKVSKKD